MIRNWKYFSPRGSIGELHIANHQYMTGNMVGILLTGYEHIEDSPRNVCNAKAFDFPVRYKIVDGADIDNELRLKIKELELEGCRFIATSGGVFGLYYETIRDCTTLPVLATPLQILNFAGLSHAREKKICIINELSSEQNSTVFDALSIDESMRSRCIFIDAGSESIRDLPKDIGAIVWDQPSRSKQPIAMNVPVFDMLKLIGMMKRSVAQRPFGGEI